MRWMAYLVTLLGGMLLLTPTACRRAASMPPRPPPVVSVSYPLQRDVVLWDEYTGRMDAVETVDVRARVSGYIDSVQFDEGALVKKGALLLKIDDRPYVAQLENAQGTLKQAQAQLRLAQADLSRGEKAASSGAMTSEELDTRRQQMQQYEGAVTSAQGAVEMARLNVEWCQVTAPIAGRISRKYVTAGNLITGGNSQATLLTTIVSVDPIYCYFDVDEGAVLKYKHLADQQSHPLSHHGNMPCYMALSNEKGFPHEGTIDFSDNRINAGTGTLLLRGVFPNPDHFLTPGMFARVRIAGDHLPQALLITDGAVGSDQNRKYVLVVDGENVVRYRNVTLGPLMEGYRVVLSGLGPKERIVVNGLLQARPGAKVQPQEVPMPAGSFAAGPVSQAATSAPSTQEPRK